MSIKIVTSKDDGFERLKELSVKGEKRRRARDEEVTLLLTA
jgi:hypothetical protein